MKAKKRFTKAAHEAEIEALKAEVRRKFKRPDPEVVRRKAKAMLDKIEREAAR